MEELFTLERGDSPLLVNVPHAGTTVPAELAARFSAAAVPLPDTDWFIDDLFDFVPAMGAGLMVASHSRYVIDLNRPADDTALYAQPTPGLVPRKTFAGQAIYRPQSEPDDTEARERLQSFWLPYHKALAAELERLRVRHGHTVLLDAHSILSQVPSLFDGVLPHLNLGSNGGVSADAKLIRVAMGVLAGDARWNSVLDGRFSGGYITRHYGRPATATHALQLETAQCAYMQESPPGWDAQAAQALTPLLRRLVQALLEWRPPRAG